MSSATPSPQLLTGAGSDGDAAQRVHGVRELLAGTEKPLGGNTALRRNTFSAAAVRFRVIFQFRRKRELHHVLGNSQSKRPGFEKEFPP